MRTSRRKKKPVYVPNSPARTRPDRRADLAARDEFLTAPDRTLPALALEPRTIFMLPESRHLPYEQIAQIEGVRFRTTRSRISRVQIS